MRVRTGLIIAATLLAWSWAAATPPTPAAVDELMQKSGLWQQLAGVGPQFVQGVEQSVAQQGMPDERAAQALQRAFATAYGADRLRAVVARELAAALSAEDIDAALAWLATDRGISITKLEEDASMAGAAPDRMERAAAMAAALSPERLERYQRLARALHIGEVGATMVINMSYALARGVRIANPGAPGKDPDEIRSTLESERPRLVAMIEQRQLAFSAITYASLSDADLDRYIAFAESPAGRRYHAVTTIGIDKALTDGATEAGRLLVTERSI